MPCPDDHNNAADSMHSYPMLRFDYPFYSHLVDDWMDAYRLSLGISLPQLRAAGDTVTKLRSSVMSARPDTQNYNADDLATSPIPEVEESSRLPSAPSGRHADYCDSRG